jgi:erythromycin esterase
MARALRGRRLEPPAGPELFRRTHELARPLRDPTDLDPLLRRIGDAHCVLLGEASHGTHEYYTWRAALSRRLITERGFSLIAVEGDWPDCYRVNRYVKGYPHADTTAYDALHAFERWPTWMWANEEVVELAQWLRDYNDHRPEGKRVGFYGLDVYSLWESMYQVLGYLRKIGDDAALGAARKAFRCFEPFGEDVQEYARWTRWVPDACEGEVARLLAELRRQAPTLRAASREDFFHAEQNALVVKNAEAYYRAMVRGGRDSWNVRDRHMAETLRRLLKHHGPGAKAIVWEHNTHIGDARYTDMADDGMVNIGQLAREEYGADDVVLVGFGSYRGTVIAAREWEAPMERMTVPPGRPNSWEDVLHRVEPADKLLVLDAPEGLEAPRGHLAIGVVYHPELEQFGNYVPTVLPRRYDAFVFLDQTTALRPLHLPAVHTGEVPETYPSAV